MSWITHQKQNTPNYLENLKARQFSDATTLSLNLTIPEHQTVGSLSGLPSKSNSRAAQKPRRVVLIGTGIFDTWLLSVAGYQSGNMNRWPISQVPGLDHRLPDTSCRVDGTCYIDSMSSRMRPNPESESLWSTAYPQIIYKPLRHRKHCFSLYINFWL